MRDHDTMSQYPGEHPEQGPRRGGRPGRRGGFAGGPGMRAYGPQSGDPRGGFGPDDTDWGTPGEHGEPGGEGFEDVRDADERGGRGRDRGDRGDRGQRGERAGRGGRRGPFGFDPEAFGPGFVPGVGPFGPGFGPAFGPGAHRGFGPGGRGGHGGPGGPGSRRGRARKGDVRLALLSLLGEAPSNGYGLIKGIEERSGGVWRTSPGSVYPTLAQLVDEGLIAPVENGSGGGGTQYTVTEAGTAYLAEHAAEVERMWTPVEEHWAEMGDILVSGRKLMTALRQVASDGTAEQRKAAAEKMDELRRELYRMLGE